MSYLLQLGALEAERPCPTGRLSPTERTIAGHLAQLGLLRPFRCVSQDSCTVCIIRGKLMTCKGLAFHCVPLTDCL